MKLLSKKFYIVGSTILLIMITITITSLFSIWRKPTKISAADEKYIITVSNVSTVSIYVTGEGVKLKSDDSVSQITEYEVEANTEVVFTCVNETRLFTNWMIKDDNGGQVNTSSDRRITLVVNKNLNVTTVRKDPTAGDVGKYITNPFSLSNQSNLLYLENIFDAEELINNVNYEQIVTAYTHFFQNDPDFKTNIIDAEINGQILTDQEKVNYIKTNKYFERIQNGYYKVQESFTVLNENFDGIGSTTHPFKGVVCGLNDATKDKSQIFLSLNLTEKTNNSDQYCGLFEVLDENAVVRNLIINNSIGISKSETTTKANIYAGGVAGKVDNSLFINLKVKATINIETNCKNVYAGGIAGTMTGGLDDICNLDLDFTSNTWALTSGDKTETYGGLIAGKAENVYIVKTSINVSNYSINAKNVATGARDYSKETKIAIGNLFGYYTNNKPKKLNNIEIKGTKKEYIHSIMSSGENFVGGLIGYISTRNTLTLGTVEFKITDTTNVTKIISESLNKYSKTNLYVGGLIAYVDGTTLVASDEFKNGITKMTNDDVEVDVYRYLFTANMEIIAKQKGIQDDNVETYGSCIAAGILAQGYFDISGKNETERSNILVTSSEYNVNINAIQSSMTTHSRTTTVAETNSVLTNYIDAIKNNYRHCLASLVFGYIDKTTNAAPNYLYQNINIYANNVNIEATREIGSRSLGDVNASGFLCDSNNKNFQNISMYLGERTAIKANSLSYEVGCRRNNGKYNNINCAYVSAFIGNASTSTGITSQISNISISGYDFNNKKEIGTSVEILGIQNSKAISKNAFCEDYTNENYVGGVFGTTRGAFNINNISFIGNTKGDSQIIMQGHRDPNSAFAGGIVGFAKLCYNNQFDVSKQTYTNCMIKNAKVYGSATISKEARYEHPDIYVAGIVGASYAENSLGEIKIENSKVIDSNITGIGNERIETFVGGVLGTHTWKGSANINNCYVLRSKLASSVDSTTDVPKPSSADNANSILGARVGGIAGTYQSATLNVSYSAVIDCELSAYCSERIGGGKENTTAGIIHGNRTSNTSTVNCYTNSVLSAKYGLEDANTFIYRNANVKNVNGERSYYVKGVNAQTVENFNNGYGKPLTLGNVSFTGESDQKQVLDLFGGEWGSTKHYVNVFATENFECKWQSNSSDKVVVEAKKANSTSEAQVWINTRQSGDSKNPTEYTTENELINAGWFKLGLKYLICGEETGDVIFEDDSFKRTYLVDDVEYRFDGVDDTGKYRYITVKEPYKYLYDLGYTEYEKETLELTGSNITDEQYKTEVLLKSITPSIKIKFSIINKFPEEGVMPPTYYASWLENQDNTVNETQMIGFGTYTYKYTTEEYIGKDNDGNEGKTLIRINYELIFTPNKELKEDVVLYVGFYIGSGINAQNKTYANQFLRFDLMANKYKLKGGTLAEYTPAVNDTGVINNLGQEENNPYHFQVNTAYRIIPVLYRQNEPDKEIISELNIQDVLYSLDNESSGSIRANGELTTSSTPSGIVQGTNNLKVYKIKLKLKDYVGEEKDVYFAIVTKHAITYSGGGTNLKGLPFATNATDYYLDINILAHCGGVPSKFKITIGQNTYNLLNNNNLETNEFTIGDENGNYQWILDENGNKLTHWDNNFTYYRLCIPKDVITDVVSIDIEFPINFMVEFHIQTDSFNPKFGENNPTILSVKVKAGTTFKELFGRIISITSNPSFKDKTYKAVLEEWSNKANQESFGYLFTGFYLIDNSTSVTSYGQNFEEILESNITINTSYVFYGRWSFLIELIEAPGTHIVTSFSQNFLYEVKQNEHEDLLRKNVIIPINNNRGYIFTIVKDKHFIGEADVEAYVISKIDDSETVEQIAIEKYHDDMYLYYIPPEEIKGYLVIMTKVSNADIIIGEDIASVTKEILPEDGIYSFKYIVNHKKGESYIYKGKNGTNHLEKDRELLLQFFEQTYVENSRRTAHKPKKLVKDTIIEVYYHKYVNGASTPSEQILGKYNISDDKTDSVKITEFTYLNGEGNPFDKKTYGQLLGDDDTVSEVYYFVIIPPNGYNNGYSYDNNGLYGGYINNYLYVGYCDSNNEYLEGSRTNIDFTNIPIEGTITNTLQYESSLQIKSYTLTPSRVTKLEKDETNSNLFHFTDDKRFNIFNIAVENGELTTNNKISFFDKSSGKNTIITSKQITQGISQLRLNFGYNKGTIKVSGSIDGANYEEIKQFDVESEIYQDYIIDFDLTKNYKYFKIEKLTDKELRLSKIGLVVAENGMLYELEFYDTEFEDIYIPTVSINNITLPTIPGLTWSVTESTAAKLVNGVLVVTPQSTNQKVFLQARLEENGTITTKNFEVTIPSNLSDITINEIHLPTKVGSTLLLPSMNGLEWEVVSGNGIISSNVVTLNGPSSNVSLKAKYNNEEKTFTVFMQDNTILYTLRKTIIGDSRHDNKRFIMALQFKDNNNNIIENIQDVTISVNGNIYSPIIEGENKKTNRNVVYFDLTEILEIYGGVMIDVKINKPNDSRIYAVQLLECSLHLKPAMGEVRQAYMFQ